MAASSSIYVPNRGNADLSLIRSGSEERNEVWIGVFLGDDDFEVDESVLISLSKQIGTVIHLAFVSSVDAFMFIKLENGICVRKLVYGWFDNQGEWEVVEGKAQDWEDTVFFEDDDGYEIPVEPLVGSASPMIIAGEAASSIAYFYGFPGWD